VKPAIASRETRASHPRRENVVSRRRASPLHLHAVTRGTVRPGWTALYLGVALAIIAGAGAHAFIGSSFGIRAVDGCAGLLTFGWMLCWIGRNRIALARLGSTPLAPVEAAGVVSRECDAETEETWLPYDFC
jgi:hypothetical protein